MANPDNNPNVLAGYLCFNDLWTQNTPPLKWPEDAEYVPVGQMTVDHAYTRVVAVMVAADTTEEEKAAILPSQLERQQAGDEFWIRKSGVRVPVGEMNEHHVRNALRFILRRAHSAAGLPKWLRQTLEEAQVAAEDNELREPE